LGYDCPSFDFLIFSCAIHTVSSMGNIRERIDEDMIGVLVDIAFIVHHQLNGEIPFELLPFEAELEVLLNTLNFTIH